MALSQRDGPRVAPGVDVVSKAETVRVDDRLLGKIRHAVDAALSYWPAPERSVVDSQVLDTKGLTAIQNSACCQTCRGCCQAEAVPDNSGHNSTMVKVIHLLAEMDPDERAALVGLLKALG